MSQTLHLSDELYRALARYAEEHHQTPEEALAALLRSIELDPAEAVVRAPELGEHPVQIVKAASEDTGEYRNPWEGSYGAFEAEHPDLTIRHDYYIGEATLDTYEDEDDGLSVPSR